MALAAGVRYGVGAPLDQARAARLYRFAAEQGLASAQYSLGRCYHEGTGIEAVLTAPCYGRTSAWRRGR